MRIDESLLSALKDKKDAIDREETRISAFHHLVRKQLDDKSVPVLSLIAKAEDLLTVIDFFSNCIDVDPADIETNKVYVLFVKREVDNFGELIDKAGKEGILTPPEKPIYNDAVFLSAQAEIRKLIEACHFLPGMREDFYQREIIIIELGLVLLQNTGAILKEVEKTLLEVLDRLALSAEKANTDMDGLFDKLKITCGVQIPEDENLTDKAHKDIRKTLSKKLPELSESNRAMNKTLAAKHARLFAFDKQLKKIEAENAKRKAEFFGSGKKRGQCTVS